MTLMLFFSKKKTANPPEPDWRIRPPSSVFARFFTLKTDRWPLKPLLKRAAKSPLWRALRARTAHIWLNFCWPRVTRFMVHHCSWVARATHRVFRFQMINDDCGITGMIRRSSSFNTGRIDHIYNKHRDDKYGACCSLSSVFFLIQQWIVAPGTCWSRRGKLCMKIA